MWFDRSRFCFGLLALAHGTTILAQTDIHEKGRCAIRGHCGKKSFFGGELPCPDNGLAREPDHSTRRKLVDLCGKKWEHGAVCCEDEQVRFCFPLLTIQLVNTPFSAD